MIKTIPTSILLFYRLAIFVQISIKVVYNLIIGYNSGFSYNQELTNMLINALKLNEDLSDSLYFDKDKSYFEINEQPINTRKYFTFFACVSTKSDRSSYSDLQNQ